MMRQTRDEAASLIGQIERAFGTVRYPGDEHIVINNNPQHLECAEIRRDLGGRDWRKIPLRILRYHHQAPAFMTPQGFQYFLPAYLLATLKNYSRSENIPESVNYLLTPPANVSDRRLFTERISRLTTKQRSAVLAFLLYLQTARGEECCREELEGSIRYWDKLVGARLKQRK